MRKVLIIHHLEPMWESGYRGIGGTSFDRLQENFIEFLQENEFDKVILTRFEDYKATVAEGYFPELLEFISKVEEYSYAWEAEMFQDASEYCEGGNHSQVVWLAQWLKDLKGCKVTLTGAFDGECIEDVEIALRHLEIEFERENSLIV